MNKNNSWACDRFRADGPRLQVSVCNELSAPTDAHQLLLAFHFGRAPAPVAHSALVSPGLLPICGNDFYECWWYAGNVRYGRSGQVRVAECADYSVAVYTCEAHGNGNIGAWTRDAYLALFDALSLCRHKRPVKIWNYIDRINDGIDDDERYRLFSVGRAQAFDTLGICEELSPTGTAIGTDGGPALSIVAILTDNEFQLVENPRQVSAFNYPRQYGPRSPRFGRGGFVSTNDHQLYLISGTASVVGHRSVHPNDAEQQLEEILRNLDALGQSVSGHNRSNARFGLTGDSVLRVYLRSAIDAPPIERRLRTALSLGSQPVLMLKGDVCRRELMVEIDGVQVCRL